MNRIFKLASVLFFFISFNVSGQNDALIEFNEKNKGLSPGKTISVSIIDLIANSEKYDGKVVFVYGFLNFEFEGTAIYLSESDYENAIYKNSIWLDIPKKGIYALGNVCSKKYGSIIGTFRANRNGHFGMFSGTISEIRNIGLR